MTPKSKKAARELVERLRVCDAEGTDGVALRLPPTPSTVREAARLFAEALDEIDRLAQALRTLDKTAGHGHRAIIAAALNGESGNA